MDNLLEILIPLIFAAIYFFGNMFGKSKDEDEVPPGAPQRRSTEEADSENAQRQRRIQEEIRRKIMERRQAASGEGAPVPSAQEQEPREAPSPVSPPVVAREREPGPAEPVFSWDASDNAYENGIEEQLKRIEATKQHAEKLQIQAAQKRTAVEGSTQKKQRSGGYFTGTVRESLQDPQAAKVAFIYGEVLGQPASLRKSQSVPGLS